MKKIFLSVVLLCGLMLANTLDEIRAQKVVRIGVDPDMPPFSVAKDGDFEGFEIEFAKRLGTTILNSDGKVEFKAIQSDDRAKALQTNSVDIVIQAYTKTAEREKLVDFAMPYFSVAIGVLTRKSDNINSINALNGKTIAIESGTTAEDYFKNRDVKILLTSTSAEAYQKVANGEADAYASDNIIVMAYPIFDSSLEVPKALSNLGVSEFLAPAVAKGNNELKSVINKVMIELSKEQYFRTIYEENFGKFYKNTTDPDQFLLEELYRIYGWIN